ncbi:MAG: DpnI domain-containing protein [Acidobacteriaceae bacterium]
MKLNCNPALGERHSSNTQRVRDISEGWFEAEGYCLNCASPRLKRMTPGMEFLDFECPQCAQGYELKSAARVHTRIVQDGGFDSMMRRIRAQQAPALMLMHYSPQWCVQRLVAVHPVFLTPSVVRKRNKPHLRPVTRREYWMCDLDLTVIPSDGKIVLVDGAGVRPTAETRAAFRESKRFTDIPLSKRGWTALVLAKVRKIGKTEFTLADIYAHEAAMHAVYPENSHVREKIRQQLQALRDLGYIEFLSKRGEYRVLL